MGSDQPNSESTVALILGAAEFPRHPELKSNPAFLNAATQFKNYLVSADGLGLGDSNVLNLFDADEEQSSLDGLVSDFLCRENTQHIRDIVVYYVGHGYFSGEDYFLALRRTRQNKPYSGYPIKALAQTLRENARHSRKYVLLDCCFAAKAVAEFQGIGALQAVVQKTASEFEGRDAGRGTALLCASGPTNPARTPLGAPCTMFTSALIDVLRNDPGGGGRRLTLHQIRDLTYSRIIELFPDDDPVRPEVHSPNQPDGDIAKLPLFPTIAQAHSQANSKPSGGSILRDALTPVSFDNPMAVHCLIITGEQEVGEDAIPLEEHVRRAWEYHGGDIASAVTRYRAEQSRGGRNIDDADGGTGRIEVEMSSLQVARAFDDVTSLVNAINAVCTADVAVFDTTDFQQAGIMLLLGVRAVARRGVTVCSVGGEYVIGGELAVPFNLQMLNLASHSAAQEQVSGSDPRDLIGKKIANGFRELSQLPDYLDLPAYDAVRRLGADSLAYRPIQYDKQVLFLCPFSQEYSLRNWSRYMSKELSGKLKEHFRRANKEGADPRLVRLLDLSTPRLVAQTLYESIRLTDMCVVDWTNCRANVMFEAGVRLATNPLGAVHVAEADNGGIQIGSHPASHVLKMVSLFKPLMYSCKPGHADVYQRMIERFEESLSGRSSNFDSLIYRTVGLSLDGVLSPAVPVAEELVRSANLLLGEDYESSGLCPVLYHDVSKKILDDVAEAAAERRVAAWLYLERRIPDHILRNDENLYAQFRTLGAQSRRWLKKHPDAALDDYIRKRMQQVRDAHEATEAEDQL
jgi:hypothetical protein